MTVFGHLESWGKCLVRETDLANNLGENTSEVLFECNNTVVYLGQRTDCFIEKGFNFAFTEYNFPFRCHFQILGTFKTL